MSINLSMSIYSFLFSVFISSCVLLFFFRYKKNILKNKEKESSFLNNKIKKILNKEDYTIYSNLFNSNDFLIISFLFNFIIVFIIFFCYISSSISIISYADGKDMLENIKESHGDFSYTEKTDNDYNKYLEIKTKDGNTYKIENNCPTIISSEHNTQIRDFNFLLLNKIMH